MVTFAEDELIQAGVKAVDKAVQRRNLRRVIALYDENDTAKLRTSGEALDDAANPRWLIPAIDEQRDPQGRLDGQPGRACLVAGHRSET
jgi:hypothetical protein